MVGGAASHSSIDDGKRLGGFGSQEAKAFGPLRVVRDDDMAAPKAAQVAQSSSEKPRKRSERNRMAVTREEIDAKLERTEARVEAVETRINATLDVLKAELSGFRSEVNSELRHLPSTKSMIFTMAGFTGFGLLAIIAVLAFGGDRFDGGVQVSGVSVEEAVEAKRISQEAGAKVDAFITRFDSALQRLEEATKMQEAPQ